MTDSTQEKLTRQQQKALHLYFRQVADELNKQGEGMQLIMSKFVLDAKPTDKLIKELLWKPLQFAMIGKESTTELLKREEIDKIYETLNKFLGENFGISIPFPSLEDQSFVDTYKVK
jgi:hypothetical protein